MALSICSLLFSQNFENDACYAEETDEGMQFVQRFEWQQMDYILKFEFHLEKMNTVEKSKSNEAVGDSWEEIECIETLENTLSIPLEAGTYRYKIIVFNLLGQAEIDSGWIPLEIIKVYEPEISNVSPSTVYMEEPQTGIFTLSGSGLRENCSITFKSEEGISLLPKILEGDDKNRELKFYIDPTLLLTGQYTIGIENEGGFSTSYSPVTVKYKKTFDFDLAAGYSCVFNIFDSRFKEYFGTRILPLSATAKATIIPLKRDFGYFGFGLSGKYALLQNGDYSTTGWKMSGNLISGYLSFVYQVPFRRDTDNKLMAILELHAGGGIDMLYRVKYQYPSGVVTDPFNVMYLSLMGGGSAQYYFTNRLYIEFNCDFTFTPSVDLVMGNLTPSLLIGWQF